MAPFISAFPDTFVVQYLQTVLMPDLQTFFLWTFEAYIHQLGVHFNMDYNLQEWFVDERPLPFRVPLTFP